MDWKELLCAFWKDFSGAVDDIKDLRTGQVLDSLNACWGRIFSRPRRPRRSAAVPGLRQGAIVAEARQVRGLHRLRQLSRVPIHPRPVADRRRKRRGRAAGVTVLGQDPETATRSRCATAVRRICPAGRGREAETVVAAAGPEARGRDPRKGAKTPFAAARGRRATQPAATRSWPASAATGPMCSTAILTPTSAATTTCSRSAPTGPSTSSSPRRASRPVRVSAAPRGRGARRPSRGRRGQRQAGPARVYVTHGKVNATLPKGTDTAGVTLEGRWRCSGEGRRRRRLGPAPRRPSRRRPGDGARGPFRPLRQLGQGQCDPPEVDDPGSISLGEALELIAEREGRPAPTARKPPAKAAAKNWPALGHHAIHHAHNHPWPEELDIDGSAEGDFQYAGHLIGGPS